MGEMGLQTFLAYIRVWVSSICTVSCNRNTLMLRCYRRKVHHQYVANCGKWKIVRYGPQTSWLAKTTNVIIEIFLRGIRVRRKISELWKWRRNVHAFFTFLFFRLSYVKHSPPYPFSNTVNLTSLKMKNQVSRPHRSTGTIQFYTF
jgi:hypothetical protein